MEWSFSADTDLYNRIRQFTFPASMSASEIEIRLLQEEGISPEDIIVKSGAGYHGEEFKVHIDVYSLKPSAKNALRHNAGKPELSKIFTYIPEDALLEESAVWEAGAKKYGLKNWEQLWGDDTIEVVMNSLLRHSQAILQGEVCDLETGRQHAAHIRCNAAMLIRYFNQVNKK